MALLTSQSPKEKGREKGMKLGQIHAVTDGELTFDLVVTDWEVIFT